MRFQVRHVTTYNYSRAVRLGPHWLRLRPRGDDAGQLRSFGLEIEPRPVGRSLCLDAEGNLAMCVWFDGETTALRVASRFDLRTGRPDAYDFLPLAMPCDAPYDSVLRQRLRPWIDAGDLAPEVRAYGAELRAVAGDGYRFVHLLNERLHREVTRDIREHGAAQTPETTLRLRRGACRDVAVLFVAVCRSHGLAARFVSGYQAGRDRFAGVRAPADAAPAQRYMHAWAEVYLPGGGWRGFDASHGLAVSNAHVALAAAARSEDAAPIEGHFYGDADSRLATALHIDVDT